MNTVAHAVVNLALLARGTQVRAQAAVLTGALIPDAPMFVFYFVEKVVRGTDEGTIWSHAYFHPGWQNFVDAFNSLPFIAAGILISALARAKLGLVCFLSMGLHVALDLPLHHDDAHRHLFPFSDWRFASPVSYWDPQHYGNVVGVVELLAVVAGSCWLWRTADGPGVKRILACLVAAYASYIGYGWLVWS